MEMIDTQDVVDAAFALKGLADKLTEAYGPALAVVHLDPYASQVETFLTALGAWDEFRAEILSTEGTFDLESAVSDLFDRMGWGGDDLAWDFTDLECLIDYTRKEQDRAGMEV